MLVSFTFTPPWADIGRTPIGVTAFKPQADELFLNRSRLTSFGGSFANCGRTCPDASNISMPRQYKVSVEPVTHGYAVSADVGVSQ